MPNVTVSEVRKQVSVSFIERANLLEMNEQRRKVEAKAYFLGAEKAFLLAGDAGKAASMRESYGLITEKGSKVVSTWAGINEPVQAPAEQNQAA